MKKVVAMLLAVLMVSVMAIACTPVEDDTYEIALITDIGTINDKSFNQGTWEGVVQYAEEFDKTYQYYQPTAQEDAEYLSKIEMAINAGAKVIVTPGYLFETVIYTAQSMYPDVTFILIDGYPTNPDADGTSTTASNTVGIKYAEHQCGFLAGYAAVKSGYTSLGYQGGMGVPAVVNYGFGFVQGAEYAAKEMGVEVTINYNYSGDFAATPDNQARAASWYSSGVEIIFAAGGSVGASVMSAAESVGTKVIGVDVDQSGESDTVVNSALKGLRESVYQMLAAYYNGTFPGGQNLVMDASQNAVGLAMESNKLENFDQAMYDALFAQLVNGEIELLDNQAFVDEEGNINPDPTGFNEMFEYVTVIYM
ncbi:MAG: BMP family ABC transporter substrate-binding protein [Clostridia bacterium]|nr:BMP family ABC transporter substrate-binding protein [Clostridia bacterium]